MIIDNASATRRLGAEDFRRWAETRTVFLSSEMRDLGPLRARVADALRDAGFSVVVFEDLGGRDEDAERAYLDGVARSDIYIGILADRYGTMLSSGRSPTHEEYLEARRRGKRISFWLAQNASSRQGNAMDFVQEIQTFHTTGQFSDADDLIRRLLQRLSEIAADDEAPWIKVGDACIRAGAIRDEGKLIVVEAEVRDASVARYLEGLRSDEWGRSTDVPIALAHRAGTGRVTRVVSEMRSASVRHLEITADVSWGEGRGGSMETGTAGLSPDDLTEAGLRAGLLGDPLPSGLGSMDFMVDATDPLAELPTGLPPATEEAVGGLLISERLLASGKASYISRFALGPAHLGRRLVELTYGDPRRYTNVEPGERQIEGMRTATS
ncbi:DUF4062 domain-containing protein [Baekduia sp. Peel2402]|uniref:DUF4062 domain-containing protein n=1 Tax=Baekduia sp. Peel2402 TaxID=3458296 RepID=UPI00403E919D